MGLRRVVVTGLGAVTPVGLTAEDSFSALLRGQSGIGPITRFGLEGFTCKIAGQLQGFDPTKWMTAREARTMDPFIHYAVAAAHMAMEDAGLGKLEGELADRAGCYIGAGLGGISTLENTHASLMAKGPRHGISAYFVTQMIVNLAPGQVAIRWNTRGPNMSHVSACASSAHSIGEAMRAIQYGTCDLMIAGGTEATITPMGIGGFCSMKAVSTRNDAPTKASRPFDADRDGFVMGEGAGILILEELEHAKKRGARIYAELVGYGLSGDANHITAPAPEGEGGQRSMRMALADAKLAPEAVGYVNAHGTSTPVGDALETQALKHVFGEHARKVAVSSTKSMTGHLLGAAGAVEGVISVLAVARSMLPPTINLDNPDPACDLDYVPHHAREARVQAAMSNSFGFGGTNATLVFARLD